MNEEETGRKWGDIVFGAKTVLSGVCFLGVTVGTISLEVGALWNKAEQRFDQLERNQITRESQIERLEDRVEMLENFYMFKITQDPNVLRLPEARVSEK